MAGHLEEPGSVAGTEPVACRLEPDVQGRAGSLHQEGRAVAD